MRAIDVCVVKTSVGAASACARGDKKYSKVLTELTKWTALSEVDFQVIGSKLAQCNTDGKLPREDVLGKLEQCIIEPSIPAASCFRGQQKTIRQIDYVEDYIATNPSGIEKIQSKLDFCMRDQ